MLRNYLEYPDKQGVAFIFLKVRGDNSPIVKLMQSVFGLVKMFWLMITSKIDIVHAHPSEYNGFYRYIPYLIIGKMFRKKVLFHIHGGTFEKFYNAQNNLIKSLIKWSLNSCDMVICLSEYWAALFKNMGVKKTEVIKNTVVQPDSNPYNPGSSNLTFMGFIEERKGLFDLIKAFDLCRISDDVTLNIYGSGENDALNRLNVEINRKERIVYQGWVDATERPGIFKDTAIFILPSYYEGLPMALLEAMAFGIPVISTPVGGIPDLISDNVDGLLINPGDITGLALAIDSLYMEKEKRIKLSSAAYDKIRFSYTMQHTINKLSDIYKELLAG